tara:strand:+ start:21973 stop:23754 length:1782 start_codon:yes stop_codon:yes gene_type:complete
MEHEILPPNLAINSMRSSGYRDTAHALAELIDNSIQAGLNANKTTDVEVICIDQVELVSERKRQRINEIAVFDNASGMGPDLLRIALQFGNGSNLTIDKQTSIGKFGMGLPNASISQCCHVDVWSWRDGKCFYTYLDLDEIKSGQLRVVPDPVERPVPEKWKSLIRSQIGDHGTLVVWSQLDRVRWKQSTTFLKNTEFIVGRAYRYFLEDKTARIRLAAFEDSNGKIKKKSDRDTKPNDPLYLMKGTIDPVPYNNSPAFDLSTEHDFKIRINDEEHLVHLKFTIASKKARHEGGASRIGKNAAKNQGVSVVRAKRELEMNSTFDNSYDPRERWWGVEVSFEPALDDIFGVTNNKQAATAFRKMDLDEDARNENMSPGEFQDELRETNDPRLPIYMLSTEINRVLSTLRDQIKRQGEGKKKKGDNVPPPGSAEAVASEAIKKRRIEYGIEGESDEGEKLPTEVREEQLQKEFENLDIEPDEAKEMAIDAVRSDVKFVFKEGRVPGPVMFDTYSRAGKLFVVLNDQHPARDGLFELLDEENEDSSRALKSLKLLLEAWARLEDEAENKKRQVLADVRSDWGRIARDFLQEAADRA